MVVGVISNCGGNVGSVQNILKASGIEAKLVNTPKEISGLNGLILPGVGRFDSVMTQLRENKFPERIKEYIKNGEGKFLGICVGMQVLFESSEESDLAGLEVFPGHFKRFPEASKEYDCPNMGWKYIYETKRSKIFSSNELIRFYFVHSYYLTKCLEKEVLAKTVYSHDIPAIIGEKNYYGVQFHPEKSSFAGQKFISNWIRL